MSSNGTDDPAAVLARLQPVSVFGKTINRSGRTVKRYIRQGMPVIMVGKTPMIDPPAGARWFLDGMPRPDTRARPRRAAGR
jgi:hypothetical protein